MSKAFHPVVRLRRMLPACSKAATFDTSSASRRSARNATMSLATLLTVEHKVYFSFFLIVTLLYQLLTFWVTLCIGLLHPLTLALDAALTVIEAYISGIVDVWGWVKSCRGEPVHIMGVIYRPAITQSSVLNHEVENWALTSVRKTYRRLHIIISWAGSNGCHIFTASVKNYWNCFVVKCTN